MVKVGYGALCYQTKWGLNISLSLWAKCPWVRMGRDAGGARVPLCSPPPLPNSFACSPLWPPAAAALLAPDSSPPPTPQVRTSSALMLRVSTPLRSLLSSMASGPPRRWLPTLAQRGASVTAALRLNPLLRHVSRFPHGSRNMASGSGVKLEELVKPDRRRLIPSANDHTTKNIMISMDKHFPITRGMDNEENRDAIEEFIAHHGNVHPANIEDGNKIAMYHDEDVRVTTMEVTDGKQDRRGAIKEVPDGDDERGQRVSVVSDDDT
ncbi:hypothetical protein C2845_PM13G01970 [Panicum miliaceum]|uniref:Uncharacterized protein n=1 Tax=Panicum miliaceum TaxID=4540 RepID=A0A3L6RMR3_PANMI|nr:hypothetical protein C2845_PM13G01970 [Panicum miliaceum]